MADKKEKPIGGDQESEVLNAIMAFEQILEAMPNDRPILEALAHAYEQLGDLSRARDYLIRLANAIADDAAVEDAIGVLERLAPFAADDPACREAVGRLQKLVAAEPATVAGGSAATPVEADQAQRAAQTPQNVSSTFNVANELSFAWNLLQKNELTQEEYATIVQDLTEMSGRDAAVTVSVLHVINDRGIKNMSRIMQAVARDCGTPMISLASFEIQAKAHEGLPLEFMRGRGVLPFDLIGPDALAVIMNPFDELVVKCLTTPFDKQLMKDVEALLRKKCHFFVTTPQEFDAAMGKIAGTVAGSGAETPAAGGSK